MSTITIDSRLVGTGQPPYVIAEVGINHNGDLGAALRMIEVAKDAGADAIKFQTFKAAEFVSDRNQMFTYTSQGKTVTEPMLDMFRRYEMSVEDWRAIRRHCDSAGITFLSTPQNRSDLDVLLDVGVSAIKVGSDDFVNLPLLRDYATTGLPLILSCGMANLAEVWQSLEAVGAFEGYPVVLLLCTSQYPTPPQDVNLLKLRTLAGAFPTIPLGFSDHTQGEVASSLAVAFEACILEKHFTLDHNLPGPDHWFSEDPSGLTKWVQSIRLAHAMMGSSLVRPTAAELDMRSLARRSVVIIQDVQAGEKLGANNIGLRRPGNGLPASFFDLILDKRATTSLLKGHLLQLGDFH